MLWEFPEQQRPRCAAAEERQRVDRHERSARGFAEARKSSGRSAGRSIQRAEAAQRLENGHTMIADDGAHAIIELDENGQEVWRFDIPNSNNRRTQTMRQVRRIANGNTLICASTLDEVWEVTPAKEIVWKYSVPFPYLAVRLENGNTLISSGDGYGSPTRLVRGRSRQGGQRGLEVRRRRCSRRATAALSHGPGPQRRRQHLDRRSPEQHDQARLEGQDTFSRHHQPGHAPSVHDRRRGRASRTSGRGREVNDRHSCFNSLPRHRKRPLAADASIAGEPAWVDKAAPSWRWQRAARSDLGANSRTAVDFS